MLCRSDVELYAQGGLTIMAWLEAPGGRVEAVTRDGQYSAKCPTFPITMGTNYEVIRYKFKDLHKGAVQLKICQGKPSKK